MKQIELVNSELKLDVADEYYEAVNAYGWYLDRDTGFAFRIIDNEGGIEFLHNFLMRKVAHWG